MPKFSKAAANINSVEAQANTAEKPSIPSPVGSRFSRRVRGIAEPIDPNMLEQIEKRNRQKNPIKNNAICVLDDEQEDISHENEPAHEEHDLATNGSLTEDETHDSGDSVDARDIKNAKQSLHFNGANEESYWAAQAEHLLTELVSRTADYKVSGLEQIYTELCRIIGRHRYEENRSLVLQELKTFIGVLR